MSIEQIAQEQHLEGDTVMKQYKEHLSDFREWEKHTDLVALVFPENFGKQMSLDEVELNDEYWTCLTNKARHGKRGSLAALIKGTGNQVVSKALRVVPCEQRLAVTELTLDFANSMDWIARSNFPQAQLIGDRFHAQKLVNEAVQEMRIAFKRAWIDEENKLIEVARAGGYRYREERCANGETRKQLLSRSKHGLSQPEERWKERQRERMGLLFKLYPDLGKAYKLAMEFRNLYERSKTRQEATSKWQRWQEAVIESELKVMKSMATNMSHHESKVLAFFPSRLTNAGAESFNAKLKGFRALLRGIRDMNFFLYRVCKLYA